jgi:hypothetical protein
MSIEHEIPEPYRAHIQAKRDELEKLEAQRNRAIATAYEIGRRIQALEGHLSEVLKLQVAAGDLPEQVYNLTDDLRLVPTKVNGVAHG